MDDGQTPSSLGSLCGWGLGAITSHRVQTSASGIGWGAQARSPGERPSPRAPEAAARQLAVRGVAPPSREGGEWSELKIPEALQEGVRLGKDRGPCGPVGSGAEGEGRLAGQLLSVLKGGPWTLLSRDSAPSCRPDAGFLGVGAGTRVSIELWATPVHPEGLVPSLSFPRKPPRACYTQAEGPHPSTPCPLSRFACLRGPWGPCWLGAPLSKAPLSTEPQWQGVGGCSQPQAPQVGATSAPLPHKGAGRCSE